MNFSRPPLEALTRAGKIALSFSHAVLLPEHMLLALLDDPVIQTFFKGKKLKTAPISSELKAYLISDLIPTSKPAPVVPSLSDPMQRMLQKSLGPSGFSPLHCLLAFYSEKNSFSVSCLERFGVFRMDVLTHMMKESTSPDGAELPLFKEKPADKAPPKKEEPSYLEQYTTLLNSLAETQQLDPLIGRDAELKRIIQILCRRRKNNPLLLGDPGVGKTALVYGLVRQIVRKHKRLPDGLKDLKVYSLDLGSLIAGTRYRGDFEERMKGLIEELQADPNALLFIDEIHTVLGAGSSGHGGVDASALLKPVLQEGGLRCIGATTYKDYQQYLEKDRAFLRRFQKVDVEEPSAAETLRILKGIRPAFEKYHGLRISDEALTAAVDLTGKFVGDRKLPDKAIDAIDEAAAALQLSSSVLRVLSEKDVEKAVADMAKIPAKHVTKDEKKTLKVLEKALKEKIFGQDKAVEALASSIKFARAGLRETSKTMASFLFFGPTGVGKTELARQLADLMGMKLLRFDMSEYMEKHTVSKLIGAPPGYVGYEQSGVLSAAVTQHPYAVLLLDEIEKAHPDLLNVLLQVMDYGRLQDAQGRDIDFKNIILIMTTNAAAEDFQRKQIGFQSDLYISEDSIKRFFSPEFRNRLDGAIPFARLSEEAVGLIVDKFLDELRTLLDAHRVTVDVSYLVRRALIDKGLEDENGARPLARMIQDKIKMPLADEMLFGRLSDGGHVALNWLGGDIVLDVLPRKQADKIVLSIDEPTLF